MNSGDAAKHMSLGTAATKAFPLQACKKGSTVVAVYTLLCYMAYGGSEWWLGALPAGIRLIHA